MLQQPTDDRLTLCVVGVPDNVDLENRGSTPSSYGPCHTLSVIIRALSHPVCKLVVEDSEEVS